MQQIIEDVFTLLESYKIPETIVFNISDYRKFRAVNKKQNKEYTITKVFGLSVLIQKNSRSHVR